MDFHVSGIEKNSENTSNWYYWVAHYVSKFHKSVFLLEFYIWDTEKKPWNSSNWYCLTHYVKIYQFYHKHAEYTFDDNVKMYNVSYVHNLTLRLIRHKLHTEQNSVKIISSDMHLSRGNNPDPICNVAAIFCSVTYINIRGWKTIFTILHHTMVRESLLRVMQLCTHMMTSSNGNNFRVTGPLCGEFTSHRWIPLTKASDAELWCCLWSAPEQTVD